MDVRMDSPDPEPLTSPPSSPTKVDSEGTPSKILSTTTKHNPDATSSSPTPTVNGNAAAKPVSKAAAKPPVSKAKSAAPPRSPSPPPIITEPIRTIRLTIPLGGPSNYDVDVTALARAAGLVTGGISGGGTVQVKAVDTSDSESEGSDKEQEKDKKESKEKEKDKEKDGKDSPKKKKNRKKGKYASEYYDTNDPFIDDSELAIDERKFFGQTKQKGFYVSSGEVALMKDSTPVKKQPPKSTRKSLLGTGAGMGLGIGAPSASAAPGTSKKKSTTATKAPAAEEANGNGTRDSPIALLSDAEDSMRASSSQPPPKTSVKKRRPSDAGLDGVDGDDEAEGDGDEVTGQKRKNRYITVTENGKKRKVVNEASFHPELQEELATLKGAIKNEDWTQKGKFPPALKPLLSKAALTAIRLDEYDEHFFSYLPIIFPYNKFTMTKLVKRTIFSEHSAIIVGRMDKLLEELKELAAEGFAKAEEEWEKSVVAWDKRQVKLQTTDGEEGKAHDGANGEPDDMDVDGGHKDPSDKDGKDGKESNNHPPAKKYRMTDAMKSIVWTLVTLSNECCKLENEKNQLEGSVLQVSEQGLRKVLYQKIVAAFPDGWMSSGWISRDVSAMKKKIEKEMDNE